MLTWREFWLPPLNLWSYPLYAQTHKKLENRKMLEKHRKFKAYWERIGKPEIEGSTGARWYPISTPTFLTYDYRIAGDIHWILRRRWIDSDFTIPIEVLGRDGEWRKVKGMNLLWSRDWQYREGAEVLEQNTIPNCIKESETDAKSKVKHAKFKAYWLSIDAPPLEAFVDGLWSDFPHNYRPIPDFDARNYRIKGDRHWELRRKWIDSDFALAIEGKNSKGDDKWVALPKVLLEQKGMWGFNDTTEAKMYREAQHENQQPVASKDYTAGYKEGLDEAIKNLHELRSKYG
jgi:hypothetical protein